MAPVEPGKALYGGVQVRLESIHMNLGPLPGPHSAQLRLLEVRGDPNVLDLSNLDQLLASVHVLPDLRRPARNDSGNWGVDFRVGEIEFVRST